jgi:hypothetical protein
MIIYSIEIAMFQRSILAGGAVAEWSKALLEREKLNENQKIPGMPPDLGTLYKKIVKHLIKLRHW